MLQFPHLLKVDIVVLLRRAAVKTKQSNTFRILVVNKLKKNGTNLIITSKKYNKIALFMGKTVLGLFSLTVNKTNICICLHFIDNSLSYTKCEFSELDL